MADEQPVLNHIEELEAEEHRLWSAESDGTIDEAGRERLKEIRKELDHSWDVLRRRRAGQPDEGPSDADVPDPLN
jgi:hypothetical protein